MALSSRVVSLPSLTGLRGVAALWVLLYHIQLLDQAFGLPASMPVLRDGWQGVDLFFVLSGFILMLTHGDEFRTMSPSRVFDFLRLRFFRVYPLATVVLVGIVVLAVCDPAFALWYAQSGLPPNMSLEGLIRTLFLATRWWEPLAGDWNQPVWSLSVEILGYLAFPVLALVVVRLGRGFAILGVAAVCLSVPILAALQPGVGFGNIEMSGALTRMFGGFVGGMLVCRLHQVTPVQWGAMRGWLAVAAAAAAILLPGAVVFAFAALIYGLAADAGPANWLLKHPVVMFLGRISFPLFLLHVMPLMALAFHLQQSELPASVRWVALGLFLVLLATVSWLLHVYVERPAHRFGRTRQRAAAMPAEAG